MIKKTSLFTGFLLFCNILLSQDFFYIKDYFVDLKLDKNGDLAVTELIQVHFNSERHGLIREIPLIYKIKSDDSGEFLDDYFNHEVFIKDIQVKDYKFNSQYSQNGIKIKIGDKKIFVNGDQTYEISYLIQNALLTKNGKTELYWNLIGDFWDEEILHAGFKLTLPKEVRLDAQSFNIKTGAYGSTSTDVRSNFQNNIIEGESLIPLGNRSGMTISVLIPEGVIASYPFYKIWFYHFKFLILPILMLFSFFYAWWKHGKDTRLADMVAYLPPKNMDSALAGFAIDIKSNQRDALSLIPYFGSLGYLKIEHEQKKGLFSSDEMTFIKLKELSSDAPAHQKIFFNGLFECGDRVKLSLLKDTFYTTLISTLSAINDAVMNSDYFTKKSVQIYWNSIWLIILTAVLNGVYCFFSGRFLFLAISILLAILLVLFAYLLLKRSESGDESFKEIKGFRKFIRLAEKSKLEFLTKEDPSYFDKTLPYAVAFNCVDEWCGKFNGLAIEPPQWYVSNVPFYNTMHGFNMSAFNESMTSSLSEMRTVMSSQPSSSGSFGSSGGGGGSFSGGGFGGGGGSSW